MSLPIGLNIHPLHQDGNGKPRGYSKEDKKELFGILERMDSTVNLFMDCIDWAREWKKINPASIVTHRFWRADDGNLYEKTYPQRLYDEYARFCEGGIILQLINEPTGYGKQNSPQDLEKQAHFYAQLMDLFGKGAGGLALPGFGEGHPHETRLSELAEYWDAQKRWNDVHYYMSHEYGTWRGMTYDDPENKWDVFPWRIGRYKFIVEHCQKHHGFIPNMFLGEWGKDSAHDGLPFRGWRTTKQTEASYAEELIKCADSVYDVPYVKGMCIYCYGNTGERNTEHDWVSFDVSHCPDFFRVLEAESIRRGTPAPAPTPVPVPVPVPIPVPTPPPAPVPVPPPVQTGEKGTFELKFKLENVTLADAKATGEVLEEWLKLTLQTLAVVKQLGAGVKLEVSQVV